MARFKILECITAILVADGGALYIHIRIEDYNLCAGHGQATWVPCESVHIAGSMVRRKDMLFRFRRAAAECIRTMPPHRILHSWD